MSTAVDDVEHVLGQVDDGLLAAAARGAPVEGDLRLAHDVTCPTSSAALRRRRLGVGRARGRRASRSGPSARICSVISLHDLLHLVALGGRDPLQADAARPRCPKSRSISLQQLEAAERLVVALLVVAVAGMAPADQHAVGALARTPSRTNCGSTRPEHISRITRTFGAYSMPRDAGQVGRRVRAPVAEEGDDPRLEGGLASPAQTYASTPSISAKICSSVNRCCCDRARRAGRRRTCRSPCRAPR